MKPSICTRTGVELDFTNPQPSMIRIGDIAIALSRKARFGGHTHELDPDSGAKLPHYSVAQHSVRVSWNCSKFDAGYGLLHDAAEAYLADVPAPAKQLLPDYCALEDRVRRAVYIAFGLDPDIEKPPSVERADQQALVDERASLMIDVPWWPRDPTAPPVRVLNPFAARELFLARFRALVIAGQLKENSHA